MNFKWPKFNATGLRRSLLVSAVAHLFAILLLILPYLSLQPTDSADPNSSSLEVILHSPDQVPKTEASNSGQDFREAHRIAQPSEKKKLDLGLVPKPGELVPSDKARGSDFIHNFGSKNEGLDSKNASSGDGYQFADSMSLEMEGETYPFYRALWRNVDRSLTYPTDFVQQRIQASVSVQLEVDSRGVFTGKILNVNGDDDFLNTFVIVTLIHALRNPLPQSAWLPDSEVHSRKSLPIIFRFQFRIFGPGESPRTEKVAHFKNILSFRRDAYAEPIVNQKIEKFLTRYMPPIIPIPGAFYIDFVRAYQLVSQIGTPDQDQLRQRRLESRKESWENLVQSRAKTE